MKNMLFTAVLYTAVTAVLLGLAYPLLITAVAQLAFHDKANGELIQRNGRVLGSQLIGQPFTSPIYFHSRPSAAGSGYDASSSGGSNLAPTNRTLVDRVSRSVRAESTDEAVPIDLVTSSASGLDPDITPAAALYQVPRVAHARQLSEDRVRQLVESHITPRQFGLLGEPRVNVLALNLAIDELQRSR